jgi:pyruvate dehydrogenase E2 component (dihydrolipoamide acetyltransferase)
MTLYAVTVPRWGLSMDEGTLASWLVAEGEAVAAGDEIAEIETSKIANVLEAPAAGVLRRQIAGEGEVRPVGALIGVIGDAGEDDAMIGAFIADHADPVARAAGAERVEPVTITVEGEPFRYLRLAPADGAPSARPLVLIHGFGGDHASWAFNQAALAQQRPVYAIDLPGHGGSTKQVGDGSLAALARRVAAWMETMGRGRVHVVGHSMGAAVAATLALDHSDRIKSLTAINGAGFGGMLNRDYIDGFLAASRRKDLKPAVELLFADPALVTREMLDDLIAAKRIDGAAEALRQIADNAIGAAALTRLARRIDQIAVPTLRIVGEEDHIVTDSPRDGARMVRAGHMPHLEAADAVNTMIAEFLRDTD